LLNALKPLKFRKEALEYLHSPEEFSQLLQVVSKKAWITLLGIYGLLIALIVWSVMGSLPTRLETKGILLQSSEIEMVVFIPPEMSNQIQSSMPVLLIPNTIEGEEYRSLKGSITQVFLLPEQDKTLFSNPINQALIKKFQDKEPPVILRIQMQKNKSEITLTPGMMVNVHITLREQPPISLIIPSFKKWISNNDPI